MRVTPPANGGLTLASAVCKIFDACPSGGFTPDMHFPPPAGSRIYAVEKLPWHDKGQTVLEGSYAIKIQGVFIGRNDFDLQLPGTKNAQHRMYARSAAKT